MLYLFAVGIAYFVYQIHAGEGILMHYVIVSIDVVGFLIFGDIYLRKEK
jgi:hypothetical protein